MVILFMILKILNNMLDILMICYLVWKSGNGLGNIVVVW